MTTATTSETSTIQRLTLLLPVATIRTAKSAAASEGLSVSDWAAALFQAAVTKQKVRRSITHGS